MSNFQTQIKNFVRANVKPLIAFALTFVTIAGGLLAYQSTGASKLSNAAGCNNGALATSAPACNICPSGTVFNVDICDPIPPGCSNGATNPPQCDVCPSEMVLVAGDCVPMCTNGAINKPACNNCPAAKYYDTATASCVSCPAGSYCSGGLDPNGNPIDKVQCPVNTYCPAGSTAPTNCPTGTVSPVGSTSASACVVPTCTNGATNPPQCDVCPAGKVFVNGNCGQRAITADELANAITCTPKVVNINQTVQCTGKAPISPEVLVTGLTIKVGDAGTPATCTLDANRLIQCNPVNVGGNIGAFDIKANSDQTNPTNPTGVKVDAVTVNNPLLPTDLNNTPITCNSGASVKVSTTTTCTFTLPDNKTLPADFKLAIGDGNPAGSNCSVGANNLVRCDNVPTGSQVGQQPVKATSNGQTADTGSKVNVTTDGNGNTLADLIKCTPTTTTINTTVTCSTPAGKSIPNGTVFSGIKVKIGTNGTQVNCTIANNMISCPPANVGAIAGTLNALATADQVTTPAVVDTINVLDYLTPADMTKVNITCNNNKVVMVNSVTICNFTLPDGKTLPTDFKMGIGDGDLSKSACAVGAGNVVTCSNVPTGSQIGSQPIKVTTGTATPTDTTQKITVVRPATTDELDTAISCTPSTARPNENVKCTGNLPANVVAEDVKVKLGDKEVLCTVSSPNANGVRTIDCPVIQAPATNGTYPVTATMKDLLSTDSNARTAPKTVDTITVKDGGSTLLPTDIKDNNLNIICNTGKDVPVNSVTDCKFTLPDGKFLPADFKLSIGDGDPKQAGQVCIVADDKKTVTCTNVPTGSQIGSQIVYATLPDATGKSTKVDTGKKVNVIKVDYPQVALVCPAGQYTLKLSSADTARCVVCPKGSYCINSEKIPCPAGFTTAGEGAKSKDECNVPTTNCPAGQYSQKDSTNGSATCKVCPAGSYCVGGNEQPKICPKGSYCPEGSSTPTQCPTGFTTAGEGAKSKDECNVATGNTIRTGGTAIFSAIMTIFAVISIAVIYTQNKKQSLQIK
jgi:hypothetical protein